MSSSSLALRQFQCCWLPATAMTINFHPRWCASVNHPSPHHYLKVWMLPLPTSDPNERWTALCLAQIVSFCGIILLMAHIRCLLLPITDDSPWMNSPPWFSIKTDNYGSVCRPILLHMGLRIYPQMRDANLGHYFWGWNLKRSISGMWCDCEHNEGKLPSCSVCMLLPPIF